MIGEACVCIDRYNRELVKLRDEREIFILANEDTMNEWLFKKKLKEYDRRIKKLEQNLKDEEDWYYDLIEYDSDNLCDLEEFNRAYDEYERQKWFEELCKIDGVGNCQT